MDWATFWASVGAKGVADFLTALMGIIVILMIWYVITRKE